MRPLIRTHAVKQLLVLPGILLFTTNVLIAQCPAGSFNNTGGTYTNGQTVCISTAVSSTITLNNGATMVVVNGGNYTGDINTNSGSAIQVQAGGIFQPGTANNFAATIANNGTVKFTSVSLASGAGITNSGSFTWAGSWNQNNAITVSNTSCGAMTYNTSANVQSSAVINNSGVLNFTSDLTTNSGTTINNRGTVTVSGNFNSSGLFYNQYKAVFKGGSNNINSGDSIVNLAYMTFSGSVTSAPGIRNEGLLYIHGSFTINTNKLTINNSNAQLRVNGSLSNNGQIGGNGSLYIGGSVGNNGTVAGNSSSQKLTVNQAISGGTTGNLMVNAGMTVYDTSTYTPTMANPAGTCTVLPLQLSTLAAVYKNKQVQLNWSTYAENNTGTFTIEYSHDGVTYMKAGEIAAAGNSTSTRNYQFVHVTNFTGTLYYRLHETDPDGQMHYSNVAIIKTGTPVNAVAAFSPNPFAGYVQTTITLETAGIIQITLYDASGRSIKTMQQQGLSGSNSVTMNELDALLPGVYLIKVSTNGQSYFQKIIK